MSQKISNSNIAKTSTFFQVSELIIRLKQRKKGLDGIAVLYAPSGWGKSFSTNALANAEGAYFVSLTSTMTKGSFLKKLLDEMGVDYNKSDGIPDLFDRVTDQLSASGKVLILDEFNRAIERPMLAQIVREIFDIAKSPILLVGEEGLPNELKRPIFKQLRRRISAWAEAKDITLEDAKILAPIYSSGVKYSEAVLKELIKFSHGSVSGICLCFNAIREVALQSGIEEVQTSHLNTITLPVLENFRRKRV